MKQFSEFSRFFLFFAIFTIYSVSAQSTKSVMVFSKTEGYRHDCIETGIKSIQKLGKENNFKVDMTEDSNVLISGLNNYDVIIFLNTTGDILADAQQEKFEKYIKKGGGFVGIHSAADTEYDWPWYGKLVGAYFLSHPKQQQATINVVNSEHLSTSFLGLKWSKFDEWYNYKNINTDINVLMKLDEKSYEGGKNGDNHPIAWYHKYEGGRVFYTGLGHTKKSYQDEKFLKHILGGINYAMGRSK